MTPNLEHIRDRIILLTAQEAAETDTRVQQLKVLQRENPTSDCTQALTDAETKLRKLNHMLDFYRHHPLKPMPF